LLLFSLQRLQTGKLLVSLYCKESAFGSFKNNKFRFMFCPKRFLILCLCVGIIDQLELLIVGDIFDERLDFSQPSFDTL
jgi:hypothetical protein